MPLSPEQRDILKDIKRFRELELQAWSKTGITLDESIERKLLDKKFDGQDVYIILMSMIEQLDATDSPS